MHIDQEHRRGVERSDDSRPPGDPLAVRRSLLKLALLGGLARVAPSVAAEAAQQPAPSLAQAEPPLPMVDARFPAEMAPGVFILPDRRIPFVPNIGIVVGKEKVLVVDCGLGIASAEKVLSLARQLAPGRRIVLTTTHAHPEHCFGAQVFKPDAHIYCNRAQRDYLLRSGKTLLEGFRRLLPPQHARLLDGVVITPADETYDGDRATLDLGGRKVEFRTWGTAHSPGDQIVHLPAERLVFAGDLLEDRMFPIIPLFPPMIALDDIDVGKWETALADIVSLQPHLIVPGHGNLGGVEIPQGVAGYFKEVRALVKAADRPDDSVLSEQIRARYPTWENSAFIAPAIHYFSQRS